MHAAGPTSTSLPTPDTPVAEAADWYVCNLRLPPIRLYGLTPSGECQCGSQCSPRNRGKHPVGRDWQRRASLDRDAVREAFAHHRGNIGLYLGLTAHVLLDADGAEGLATLESWNVPPTLGARSGSGAGAHRLYELAADQDPSVITDRRVAPGLDVKVRGQFVVAPSRHASGGVYEWTEPLPIAVLPTEVYVRIRRMVAVPPAPRLDEGALLVRRAQAYVAKIPPAVSGQGGHQATFAVARALATFVHKGLAEPTAWELLVEYSARCDPPWSAKELEHKFRDALTQAHSLPAIEDRASSVQPVAAATPAPPASAPDWRSLLMWLPSRGGRDKLDSHVENVIRILQHSPEWTGRVRFDTFRSRIVVVDPPWDAHQRPTSTQSAWTDEDATRLHAWMRAHFVGFQFCPTVTDCERAVAVVSRAHDFNPVREYLSSLTWDGTPRLGSWVHAYLGTPVDEYARLVGTWWLISAVARIFDPGCKVDTVPILEGKQGIRKSSVLRTLAGAEWFNDTPIDIGTKDAYSGIQGCWFVELAELESLMRAEASRAKAFFSSSTDRFRRAYARHEREERRQCIFVGTVNLAEYLSDPTGARRFWPIRCTRIDLDAVERDRDQLWAEAVHEYLDGRVWYPAGELETDLLDAPQAERTKQDAWEDKIGDYLSIPMIQQVTVRELLESALKLDPRDWTQSAQTRVGIIIASRFRWAKRRLSDGGARSWIYERPGGVGP